MDAGIDEKPWPTLLMELRRAGYGPSKVAVALNVDKSVVSRWQNNGVEPLWSTGQRLIRLHARVVERRPVKAWFAVHVQ